jgi:hypothetical protein
MSSSAGKYCKAYPITRLEKFDRWQEKAKLPQHSANEAPEEQKLPSQKGFLYLHDNYTVTDGVHIGKDVIFDDVSDEWIEFCKNNLLFEVPAEVQ